MDVKKSHLWAYLALVLTAASGNFSAFKVLSITPIQFLLIGFLILNFHEMFNAKIKVVTITTVLILMFAALMSFISFKMFYDSDITYFYGAKHPNLQFILSFGRMMLVLLTIIIILSISNVTSFISFMNRYCLSIVLVLTLTLVCQALIYNLSDMHLGYIFYYGERVRYAGFLGEPQTIQGWISSASIAYVLLKSRQSGSTLIGDKNLITIQALNILALYLTESSLWVACTALFYLVYLFKFRFRYAIILSVILALLFAMLGSKINADLLNVSERSITLLAGYELYTRNMFTIIFGYGLGMSPYLIISSSWFEIYPMFLLSEFGRQVVMNSLIGLIFELGLSVIVVFFIFLMKIRLRRLELAVLFFAIMGTMVVGNGFWSPFFLLNLISIACTQWRQS